jgi:hypothetical protein
VYVKEKNEDFMTLLSGVMGRIHIQIGDVLDTEIDKIKEECNSNKQIQALAQVIDASIIKNYKLWPTNYIAYDILNKTKVYSTFIQQMKNPFGRRLEMRIDAENPIALQGLLHMYANPVVNKLKYDNELKS